MEIASEESETTLARIYPSYIEVRHIPEDTNYRLMRTSH
jgi:hypothetical protein